MFIKRGANVPNIQIRYLGELIRVVDAIKYLGLNFSGNKKLSPDVENLTNRFAVQNRINNIAGLSPERVEGGGQPVLSFEQCFILYCSFPLLFAFVVGGLGFEL